ncbi:hypothetical protein Q5P01_025773 [Channa striata]|uniref:Mitochondrial import receptor subunit TOM20 homolog n=1 Tax=Channa striata TaxID=64152 RepID=A0AA88IN98_CHASR|nr:hypothetical protein Q5P01_025773 [Channa striata]
MKKLTTQSGTSQTPLADEHPGPHGSFLPRAAPPTSRQKPERRTQNQKLTRCSSETDRVSGVMMGGRTGAIAAGVCGALLVGYCIYFDRKRRSDPDFKNRLRERRRKQKAAKERAGLSKLPDLKDAEAVQKFFLEEIQLGEELLAQGDYEKGVDHLTNAIAVCGQPQQLLQVLQQTLPPPVFQMLLTKLPSISQRIVSAQSLSEDDIE